MLLLPPHLITLLKASLPQFFLYTTSCPFLRKIIRHNKRQNIQFEEIGQASESESSTLLHWLRQSLWLCSVQFSRSVVSNSLWPHELQHARSPCPSPTPGVHPNSCPSSQCCHPTISSSVIPFSSCPQCLPASESFPMSQLFARGGQSPGVSALASSFQRNPGTDLL